jgi:uncharacterized delta-60 repeat protein
MNKNIIVFFTLFIGYVANSQIAGTIDQNFGTVGTVFSTGHKSLFPYSVDFEANSGEIATAGSYLKSVGFTVGFIGRYDFYGNSNNFFGSNGILEVSDLSTTFQSIDKVLFIGNSNFIVRGRYKDSSNTTVYFFRKYFANGTLDTSFGIGGIITGLYGEIHGNYIYWLKTNSITLHQSLSRYNLANGTLDPTFNNSEFPFLNTVSNYFEGSQNGINFQTDGKIVLCGYTIISGVHYPFVGRYDGLGNIDTTFGKNGYFYGTNPDEIWQTKTQSDGKIILLNNVNLGKILTRLNSNGTLDTTYGTGGSFYYTNSYGGGFIDKILIQSDDKVLLCGSENMNAVGSSALYLGRITNGGILDFWRKDLQSSTMSENWSMVMQNDSYVLTFGQTSNANFTLSNPAIQRIYLKAPIVSLIGDAYPGGNYANDLDMSSVDGTTYTLNNVNLTSGNGNSVKFRIDHNLKINWGSPQLNSFPTGIGQMGQAGIIIPTSSTYNISFNIATGVYDFANKLGIKEQFLTHLSFYPNPTKSVLNLQLPNGVRIDKIMITDLTGKVVLSQKENSIQVNVEQLPYGMYIIEVFSSKGNFASKFEKN